MNNFWRDEDIIEWAEIYVYNRITLIEMEKKLKVSHSTIWWCFKNRLSGLDLDLYEQALEKSSYNKKNRKWVSKK